MEIYERIETAKKRYNLKNRDLCEVVGNSEMGFGQDMRRKKFSELETKALNEFFDKLEKVEIKNPTADSEGFNLKEQYEKLVNHYVSLVGRLERELDFERSKNNKI